MIIIETYYLIDFENVNKDGLVGCNKLDKNDTIVIFFTDNAKKIDMSDIADHGEAELEMYKIPAGKQSVDIHIGSYLGYLAGEKEGSKTRVIIVSKDTDYDNVIRFWKEKTGISVSRSKQIKIETQKTKEPTKKNTNSNTANKVSGTKKTKLNQEVMQAVRNAGCDASVANNVAQMVTGAYGNERMLSDVHNALKSKYTNYKDVYAVIKPVVSKYSGDVSSKNSVKKSAVKSKSEINLEIMRILSKAGYEDDIVGYVASVVVKNYGLKNGKQQIYRTIISTYGQGYGLNIYNHIKKYF